MERTDEKVRVSFLDDLYLKLLPKFFFPFISILTISWRYRRRKRAISPAVR